MSLWNPYAFTPTGERASVAAPPALRIVGGKATSTQLGMAQAAFAQFCGRSRVSFWRNPNEQGLLPDGSRYKIMVVGNSTVMTVWPQNAKDKPPGKWGIMLTTKVSAGYINKLFTPGGEYDKPDGTWDVTDVQAGSRDGVYITSSFGGKFPSWAKNRTFSTPTKRSYITSYGGFGNRRFIQPFPQLNRSPVALLDSRTLLALASSRGGLELHRLTMLKPGELFPPSENPYALDPVETTFDIKLHQNLVIGDMAASVPFAEDFCISKDGSRVLAVYQGEGMVIVPGVPEGGQVVRWAVPNVPEIGASVAPDLKATYGYTDGDYLDRPRDRWIQAREANYRIAEYRLQGNSLSRVGLLFNQTGALLEVDPIADWKFGFVDSTPNTEYRIGPYLWGDTLDRNFPVWSTRTAPQIVVTSTVIIGYDMFGQPLYHTTWKGSGPVSASEQSSWKSRGVLMNYFAGNEPVVLVAEGEGTYSLTATGNFDHISQLWDLGFPSEGDETHNDGGSITRTRNSFVTLNNGERFQLLGQVVSESGSYTSRRTNRIRSMQATEWRDDWMTSDVSYSAKLLSRGLYLYDPSLYLLVYTEGSAEHSGGFSYEAHDWDHRKGPNTDQGLDSSLSNNCPLPNPQFSLVIRFGNTKQTIPIVHRSNDPVATKLHRLSWGVTSGVEPEWQIPSNQFMTVNSGRNYGTPAGALVGHEHWGVNKGRVAHTTFGRFNDLPRCVPLECRMPTIEVYYAKDPWTGAALLLIKPYQIAGGISVNLTVDEPMAFAIDRQGVRRVSALEASVLVNQTTNINPE
ncbi:hypothetical protein M2375_000949 [Comamonas sp. BIGb0152]|uniref:hypothetical protein n=1 Tax=Comamonas sp. BIGb0152 TaxID=2940601 RepID=UPI002166D19D|nr:hypothetical protein [Comamonas sp. BIGb0152]MCS4292743.1 hypothetical protein [Comamonas sp. BIGb0152]